MKKKRSAGNDPSVDGGDDGDNNGDDIVDMALNGRRLDLINGAF